MSFPRLATASSSKHTVQLTHLVIEQPLDHAAPDGRYLSQHIDILTPSGAPQDAPVLLILGGESQATLRRLLGIYKAYGERQDLIMIQAEHRGYGNSISADEDQTIPAYVTIDQALADFAAVIRQLQGSYPGHWMAAGYSYSGGLVIELAVRNPGCLRAILSSSGVIDWPFCMTAYDARVRQIFKPAAYQRMAAHIHRLQPQNLFDRNWLAREFLIAFIHGVSQFSTFKPYRPIFEAALRLPTSVLIAFLHLLDRTIAQQAGWNYAAANSKRSLTRREALSMQYTWRTWRYQQANETGIFETSAQPGGIFNRTVDDFVAEAQALFGPEQPRALQAKPWSPRAALEHLTIPLVYVAGEFDPWEGLGLQRQDPLPAGRYFFAPGGLHCPDIYDPKLGRAVIAVLLDFGTSD